MPRYEEQIVVLSAEDESAARAAATVAGEGGVVGYSNEEGENVEWRFVTVIDVKELFDETIGHGTQVFYRFLTSDEADVLRRAGTEPLDE